MNDAEHEANNVVRELNQYFLRGDANKLNEIIADKSPTQLILEAIKRAEERVIGVTNYREAIEIACHKVSLNWDSNRQRFSFYEHFEEAIRSRKKKGS